MANILIVEDERIPREHLKSILSSEGHDCITVETGHEVLRVTKDKEFSIVLLDILLPDMCGFDILRRFAEDRPYTKVIIITGVATEATDVVKAMRMGAEHYLIKPIDPARLIQVINESLEGMPLRRERYCAFIGEICTRVVNFRGTNSCFLAYPSRPRRQARFMERLSEKLSKRRGICTITWKSREGSVADTGLLFCNVLCDRIFSRNLLLCEITKWNQNVLFEWGFALGIGRKCYALHERDTKEAIPELLGGYHLEYYSTEDELLERLRFDRVLESGSLYGDPTIMANCCVYDTLEASKSVFLLFPNHDR